tara:strand:+ start:256 stop:834 length:579 start_codon:yes stop_codon:yes gene_type:complete
MRSDVFNKNSNEYGDLLAKNQSGANGLIQLGNLKIQTFIGSLASTTAATTQYTSNDIMQYMGALDVSVPDGYHDPQKILIERAIFSCTTAAGETLIGNFQLSATGGSAENGGVSTGTEIFGADASMVAPDGSGGTTGYTEADLNFNSAGITYASPNIAVATSKVHLYACAHTTLNADATAGRFMLKLEYSVI